MRLENRRTSQPRRSTLMALNFRSNTRFTVCLSLALLCVPLECVALAHPTPLHRRTHASAVSKTAVSHKAWPPSTAASKTAASHKAKAAPSKSVASRTAAKTPVSGFRTATRSSSRASVATSHARTANASVLTTPATRRRYHGPVERFTASSFTDSLTLGDSASGEDPVVRDAAVQALGNMNGTAL